MSACVAPATSDGEPPVEELLAVDREYRRRAKAGALKRIAPHRLNPSGEAWLPVLHAERDGRRYTALFSNTLSAHRWGRTRSWVVLYYQGGGPPGQATVVTEWHGPLRGKRVVRGREAECLAHYGLRPILESEVVRWSLPAGAESGGFHERRGQGHRADRRVGSGVGGGRA